MCPWWMKLLKTRIFFIISDMYVICTNPMCILSISKMLIVHALNLFQNYYMQNHYFDHYLNLIYLIINLVSQLLWLWFSRLIIICKIQLYIYILIFWHRMWNRCSQYLIRSAMFDNSILSKKNYLYYISAF